MVLNKITVFLTARKDGRSKKRNKKRNKIQFTQTDKTQQKRNPPKRNNPRPYWQRGGAELKLRS